MNFLCTVVSLCTSFSGYRPVRDLPVSSSLKYLLKLMALLALVLMVSLTPVTMKGLDEFCRRFDKDRPEFSIREGTVVTSAQQPATWGDAEFHFVLDTTGKVAKPDSSAHRGLIFHADSFTFWMQMTNAPEASPFVQTQKLLGYPDGLVNGAYFRRLVRTFTWIVIPLTWVLLVLAGLLMCSVQACLFSVVASLMERSTPRPLRFHQLLNIALHAVTPAAIIFTAYKAMQLRDLNLWIIYLVAYGVFLVGATNACRDRTVTQRPHEDELL
jgi:hypothetical protein